MFRWNDYALLLATLSAILFGLGCEDGPRAPDNFDEESGPCIAPSSDSASIDSVQPARQRVHEFIVLRGSGFGNRVGLVRFVKFVSADETIDFVVENVYVWRHDRIQVRVPVGFRSGGSVVPVPAGEVSIQVVRSDGVVADGAVTLEIIKPHSAAVGDIILEPPPVLAYEERTSVDSTGHETTGLLGPESMNLARTKDAEVGDIDADGDADILDNNSRNVTNGTHTVLHLNDGSGGFTQRCLEPLDDSDSGCGDSAVDVDTIDEFFGDGVTYDADLADIDCDDDLDLLQTATMGTGANRIRVLENGSLPLETGLFFHDNTSLWLEGGIGEFSPDHNPDDIDHIDFSRDGRIDFVVTGRVPSAQRLAEGLSSVTKVLRHEHSTDNEFELLTELEAPDSVSTHDAFFLFADGDTWPDLVLCHELLCVEADDEGGCAVSGAVRSELYLHSGQRNQQAYELEQELALIDGTGNIVGALTGAAADLNGDGLDDFVLLGRNAGRVFLNQAGDIGTFATVELPAPGPHSFYDVEVGDLDLDGDLDLIGAATPGGNAAPAAADAVRVWLNGGSGVLWTVADTTDLLPGLADVQRISADLLDIDGDDDLDLYLAGPDRQHVDDPESSEGRAPNQLFENLLLDG